MTVGRLPLIGQLTERTPATDKDTRLKNIHIEALTENALEKQPSLYAVKRWGLKAHTTTSAAAGRGIYVWQGFVYAVIGNTIYKDGVSIGTIATTTGRVSFDQAFDGTGLLLINDGNSNFYTVNPADTIALQADPQLPTTFLHGIVLLDQFAFLMDVQGNIHNSDVGDVTAWSGDSLNSEVRSDDGVTIARYINYLVAFGTDTIDMFYDAAHPVGSPLSRFEGMVSLVGCASATSVVNCGQHLYFIARESKGGGRFVGGMRGGFEIERVSTVMIEEYLDKEGADITNAYGYYLTKGGKRFYILTIPTTADKTFAYDIDNEIWMEWTSDVADTETHFTGIDAADLNGVLLVLDEDNGRYYEMDPETYQDNTGAAEGIKVEIRTKKLDFDSTQNKFMWRLSLVGDLFPTSADVSIEWSDDDYVTWSTARTIDNSTDQAWLTRCGMFKRRAFRLKHQANTPLRLVSLEGNVDTGHYGRS